METIKLINKNTGVVKEVKNSLASDYIGTGDFEFYTEKQKPVEEKIVEEQIVPKKKKCLK